MATHKTEQMLKYRAWRQMVLDDDSTKELNFVLDKRLNENELKEMSDEDLMICLILLGYASRFQFKILAELQDSAYVTREDVDDLLEETTETEDIRENLVNISKVEHLILHNEAVSNQQLHAIRKYKLNNNNIMLINTELLNRK